MGPTLFDPMNCSLTGSSVPWNSLGKNTGVSGLPFPTPGDLSNPGIKFAFPAFLLHLESPPAMLEAEKGGKFQLIGVSVWRIR